MVSLRGQCSTCQAAACYSLSARLLSGASCKLLSRILEGEFVAALLRPEAQRYLPVRQQPENGTALKHSIGTEHHGGQEESLDERQIQLQTAVACLLLFLQANLTGSVC